MRHALAPALALALLATPLVAAADPPAITDVTVRAISHVDGKIYDLDKLPQDDNASYEYGGDMDLVVGVALSGESTKPAALTLEIKTPGFDSEATGKVKASKAKLSKKNVTSSAEKRWEFFLVDRPCDKATFTAKYGKSTKTTSVDLFCAE